MSHFNAYLADLIRAAGQELIDRADDIAGTGDLIADLDIWIRFPINERAFPEIEIQRTHGSRRIMSVVMNKRKYREEDEGNG